jgi:hypothetical protein
LGVVGLEAALAKAVHAGRVRVLALLAREVYIATVGNPASVDIERSRPVLQNVASDSGRAERLAGQDDRLPGGF